MPGSLGITVARKSTGNAKDVFEHIKGVGRLAAYVGVPASTSKDRNEQLLKMAGKTKPGSRKEKRLKKAAKEDVNNAELLFIFSKGSPARNQPPRDVLLPSVSADGNREPIARELKEMVSEQLKGDKDAARKRAGRAAIAGQNAARRWFTDSRNNWSPNAPSTVARKGSDKPGIDTGAMRAAIQGIVDEE